MSAHTFLRAFDLTLARVRNQVVFAQLSHQKVGICRRTKTNDTDRFPAGELLAEQLEPP